MKTLDAVVYALPDVLQASAYHFALDLPGLDDVPQWRLVQPDSLLPALLVIAETLWREATQGAGFGLQIEEDRLSALGFRVTGIFHVPASLALLALDAALDRMADDAGVITLETLGTTLVASSS